MLNLPARLSEPLPKFNWRKEGKSWVGHRWTREAILPALQAGQWFSERVDYAFRDRETAAFAFAATKVYDILREQHATSA